MDNIFKQAYSIFTELIGNGMCILPPDKDFLFYEEYDFSYINIHHRDGETKLVGKREKDEYGDEITKDNPIKFDYECAKEQTHYIDFADSANKTGHLAFCNSLLDQKNLSFYENENGLMVRHPTQIPWNNPNNSTRDQLIAYAAGCWRAGKNEIVQRLLKEHEKRTNALGIPQCQNSDDNCPGTFKGENRSDILGPHHIMFLRICAGDKEAYKDPIGQLFLQLDIEATTKDVTQEKNQLIVMAIVCGRLDLFVQVHDNYKENIIYYWDNRVKGHDNRDQRQIGEAYIKVIEQELKRYSGQMRPIITGIPFETILVLLRNFEYIGKIFKGDIPAVTEYIELFANALISDAQKIAKEVELYISNALKNPINILNLPFMPFNPVAKLLNNLFNGTDLSEVYARLNEIQKGVINLTNLVKELKDDVKAIPERVAAYDASLKLDNLFKQFEINYQAYCELLSSNNKTKINKIKPKFEKLAKELLENIITYSTLYNNYAYSPLVIACMDVHLSCLAMAKEDSTIIKKILELQYKPWFENIVNDNTEKSLGKTLSNLQNIQRSNKLSIPPLFTINFILKSLEISTGYFITTQNMKGSVIQLDYVKSKLLDEVKIANLQPILERQIIIEDDLPELLIEKEIGQTYFELNNFFGGNYIVNINLEKMEAKYTFRSIDIYEMCLKRTNQLSPPWPQSNKDAFNSLKLELINIGESIIRHATIKYNCQIALEKIEEIITTLNEQTKK